MLRSAHSSHPRATALLAAALLPLAASGQQDIKREGNVWSRTITMVVSAQPRLRIEARGPVTLETGVSTNIQYAVKFTVAAQDEAEARRILEHLELRAIPGQGMTTLLPPGGRALATVWVKAPRLEAATIATTQGGVNVRGIDGTLNVEAVGDLHVDRVGGDCSLFTGGGDVKVGEVGGGLRSTTKAGRIEVKSVRGESILATDGGNVVGWQMGGPVHAHTGAGNVLIVAAAGTVDASSGGGEVQVVRAGGAVIARNMLGPVTVGGASGVQCENATGGVRVGNIMGPMRISTAMGSIVASLLGSRIADSSLATGNGDITVAIPSNVGVTIRADNELSDTMRRITSEFPDVRVRRQGTHLVAEGAVNGGGPVLQVTAAGGSIYIRRLR